MHEYYEVTISARGDQIYHKFSCFIWFDHAHTKIITSYIIILIDKEWFLIPSIYIVLINVIICITYLDLMCRTFIQSRANKILISFLIIKYRNSLKSYGSCSQLRTVVCVRLQIVMEDLSVLFICQNSYEL